MFFDLLLADDKNAENDQKRYDDKRDKSPNLRFFGLRIVENCHRAPF